MIQNLIFRILFLKMLFRAYNFFIFFVQTFQWTLSEFFFNFKFSSRKTQSQQKLAIVHFTIQFRSKNLTHFTNPNSLDIENNKLPQHNQKALQIFQQTCFCLMSEKHLHCTISGRARTAFLNYFESQ